MAWFLSAIRGPNKRKIRGKTEELTSVSEKSWDSEFVLLIFFQTAR